MEGIFTLIIIIIVFNLFNFIVKAIRGSQQAVLQQDAVAPESLPREEPVRRWKDDDFIYRSLSSGETERSTGYDARESTGIRAPETAGDEEKPTVKPAAKRAGRVVARESGQPSTVTTNLQQVLTQKEPLVAAFIFHEIIDPPLALRRRRK